MNTKSTFRKNANDFLTHIKDEKGITLIALVVTIVVLLILAGISISIVLGEGGIIDSARKAGEATNEAIENEQQMLQNVVNWVDEYLSGNTPPTEEPTLEDLVGKPEKENNIVIEDEEGTPQIVIPGKYKVVGPDQDPTIDYGEDRVPQIDEGVVIQDTDGNQFVWVPVKNINTMAKLQSNGTDYEGKLYDFDKDESGNSKATEMEDYGVGTENFREPDVLADTELGDASTELEDEKSGMTLLREIGVGTETTDWAGMEQIWKKQLQNEFNSMIASVKAYGGFYIGRYETGGFISTGVSETPVVKAGEGNGSINNANWYYMYASSKNLAKNNKVTSSMIWGSQWDAVMNWFLEDEKTAGYVTNGKGMGWDEHNYETENPNNETGKPINGDDGEVKNRVKNIYDMAGNKWEWTLEAKRTNERTHRGITGNESGDCMEASIRSYVFAQCWTGSYIMGSRATLLCNP